MKSLLLIITFLATLSAIGQETLISSKQLSDYEIQSFFTDSLKNKLQIEFQFIESMNLMTRVANIL